MTTLIYRPSVSAVVMGEFVSGTRNPNASKLHLRRLLEHLAFLDADVEEIPRRKSERARQQHGGELLDAGVVFLHRVVEEAARGGDLVLDVGELGLELLEVLAGLEIGVSLAQGEQLPQRPGERVLGRGLGGDPARLRRNRGVARLHQIGRASCRESVYGAEA